MTRTEQIILIELCKDNIILAFTLISQTDSEKKIKDYMKLAEQYATIGTFFIVDISK